MFRLISWLIYMMTNQQKRESSEYLWMVYEKVKYSQKKWEQNLYGYILHRIFRENGANIPIETEFADYPVFPHGPSGVFISQGAKIGKNCVIFQQVTIGSNMLKDSKGFGAPTIGDDVYIGAGARIIGNVRIGNQCRIGANCVVTRDVPDRATVVLAEPRVLIHKEERDNSFRKISGEIE